MILKEIILPTNALTAQLDFYEKTLGFPILQKNQQQFTVKIGHSKLTFEESSTSNYYHFAFNVPSFQIKEALDWLKQRVDVIPESETKEIIDFVNWNAEAIYFYDAAGNIGELIARKNQQSTGELPFSVDNIQSISEIGLPMNAVKSTFDAIKKAAPSLEKFSGDFERFCAAGNDDGLFILVNQQNKLWFPTTLPAKTFPLKTHFQIEEQDYFLEVLNGEEILVNKSSYLS